MHDCGRETMATGIRRFEMAQSMNTKVEYVCSATAFKGIEQYGKIMVGDKSFEFYDDRNVENYVQIPWEEITYIVADVAFGGKWLPRFEVEAGKAAYKPRGLCPSAAIWYNVFHESHNSCRNRRMRRRRGSSFNRATIRRRASERPLRRTPRRHDRTPCEVHRRGIHH